MQKLIAILNALLIASPIAVSAQDDIDAHVDQAIDFIRQHCVDPMLEQGQANAEDLVLENEDAEAAKYISENEFMSLTVIAPGQSVPPGCVAYVFTQAPGESVEIADARAGAIVQRMSAYIQNTVAPDVSDKLRDCASWENSARFLRQPGLTAAKVSSDGVRTVLVTGERRGAIVSITAMDFGPLSDCDGNGG